MESVTSTSVMGGSVPAALATKSGLLNQTTSIRTKLSASPAGSRSRRAWLSTDPLMWTLLMRHSSPSRSRSPVPDAAVASAVLDVKQQMDVPVCAALSRCTSAASFFLLATKALS